jgi:hypothetical protein
VRANGAAEAVADMDVTERLVTRRARLAPFCQVEPVKQHLRLQSYFQLARQLYRQSEIYFAERDFDNAYDPRLGRLGDASVVRVLTAVCLPRSIAATCSWPSSSSESLPCADADATGQRPLTTVSCVLARLCSKVITAHRDYEVAKYKKERDWVRQVRPAAAMAGDAR